MSSLQRRAFSGSSLLCSERLVCHRCLVGERGLSGEIISVGEGSSNQLFTVVVSVQKCFSKCYFEIGNAIVEMFKELSLSFQVCVAFGSSYCIN